MKRKGLKGFRVEICIENDAFADGPMTEVASILRGLAFDCENGKVLYDKHLLDSNGHTCGVVNPYCTLTGDIDS